MLVFPLPIPGINGLSSTEAEGSAEKNLALENDVVLVVVRAMARLPVRRSADIMVEVVVVWWKVEMMCIGDNVPFNCAY